jgi:hypothetical protein
MLSTRAALLLAGGATLIGGALLLRRPEPAPQGGPLGPGYVAGKPVTVVLAPITAGKFMRRDAAAAFMRMEAAARAAGHTLSVTRAFATRAEQERLYALYKAGRGNLAAKPGYSNHQAGLAVDIAVGTTASPVYRWLHANAARFGFVRTVSSEPWHWEYRPGQA